MAGPLQRPVELADPIHAAGGRRHYNSVRQFRAELRRIKIICFLADSGVSLLVRGTQRALARRFGVSEATISRDLEGILAERGPSRCCPFCGAKPLDEEGVRSIEEGHDKFRRWARPVQ
jgi:DNA repair exonuclease SbcCD ATPase subunit